MKTIKFYQQALPEGWHIVSMYVKDGQIVAEIERS